MTDPPASIKMTLKYAAQDGADRRGCAGSCRRVGDSQHLRLQRRRGATSRRSGISGWPRAMSLVPPPVPPPRSYRGAPGRPPSTTPRDRFSGPIPDHHVENAAPASSTAWVSGCRYRLVTAGSWWPATRCNRWSSTPASVLQVSAVCRSPWRTRPGRPSSWTRRSQLVASLRLGAVMTPPRGPSTSRSSLWRPLLRRWSVGRTGM